MTTWVLAVRIIGRMEFQYEIRIEGVLGQDWSAWFDGLRVSGEPGGVTVITGPVADQAALHGLLAKVRDLALPLLSVRRINPSGPEGADG